MLNDEIEKKKTMKKKKTKNNPSQLELTHQTYDLD